MLLLAAVVLLLCWVYGARAWGVARLYALATRVRTCPGALPLVGHAHLLMGSNTKVFDFVKSASKDANENGGISLVWFGPIPNFVITDPEDAATVLNSCLNKHYIYYFFQPGYGNSTLTAEGEAWRRRRRLLAPAFHTTLVYSFLDIFNNVSAALVTSLNDETKPFDITSHCRKTTYDAFCDSFLGGALKDQELKRKYIEASQNFVSTVMKRITNVWMQVNFLFNWTESKKVQDESIKIFQNISQQTINKRKVELSQKSDKFPNPETNNKYKPFLDLLLHYTKDDLGDIIVREEIDIGTFAGSDAIWPSLTYLFLVLGSNSTVQEDVFNELHSIFGNSKRKVEKDDLSRMIYTEAVINEALRLYPIGSIVGRSVDKDTKIKNYTLPAGSSCIISYWGILRGPAWGPDCEQFRPERWLDPSAMPEHPAADCRFSFGKKMCMGKTYAMVFMKIVTAHVVRRFRMRADISQVQHQIEILLQPAAGHYISLERR